MQSRIDTAFNYKLMEAGWPPRANPSRGEQTLKMISTAWAGGDLEPAQWLLARVWLRERARRTARATAMMLPAFLFIDTLWLLAGLSLAAWVVTRTHHSWAYDFSMTCLEQADLRACVTRQFNHSLPACVLSDAETRDRLLGGLDAETRHTVMQLADEWPGSVGDLVFAARAL